MAGLEGVIRPFVRPDTLARRRLVASNTKVDVTPAIISWGTSGTLASAHQVEQVDPDGVTIEICKDDYVETKRFSDVMRIEQKLPDGTFNPDNFVDLDRPYKVYFERQESPNGGLGETTHFKDFAIPDSGVWGTVPSKCTNSFTLKRNLP